MRGYLLLSEARSGSSWLGSMANATGKMGKATEALDRRFLEENPSQISSEDFYRLVLDRTSTANNRFGVKIFPKHLKRAQSQFGFDFIAKCQGEHDVKLILLRRRDRIAQAISLHRARVTSQWKSDRQQIREPEYSFEGVCNAYFQIAESEAFWHSYCELRQLEFESFVYEDLRTDPSPYLIALAAHLQVSPPTGASSRLRVQGDDISEQWRRRFEADARSHGLLVTGKGRTTAPRTVRNLVKFLKKEALEI